MNKEQTVFSQYLELWCFLSAYFKLVTLHKTIAWQQLADEIVTNCTAHCVATIMQQITALLDDSTIKDRTLVSFITRFAAGWQCETADEARQNLLHLQTALLEARQRQLVRRPAFVTA